MINKTPNWSKIAYNLNNDFLFLTVLSIIWGGIVYYLYALNNLGFIISLILIISSFIILRHFWTKKITKNKGLKQNLEINEIEIAKESKNSKLKNKILLASYVLLYLFLATQLYINRSGQALVSPWQALNCYFFIAYALASLSLILIIVKQKQKSNLKLFLISAHYLISFSVAVIIYKVGYGFDPFIHQATMKLINIQGVVLPKTPYYLGEYGLIIIGHKISGLAIANLNKIIVPALSALFLPVALYRFLKNHFLKSEKNILLTILFLLILTFSPFISSTPQNLSYLFLILTVLASFDYPNLSSTYLLTGATAIIHPLTGLPTLIFVLYLSFKKYQQKIKLSLQRIIKPLLLIIMAGILPGTLLLAGGGRWRINGKWPALLISLKNIFNLPSMVGQKDYLSNFIYFFANNYKLLLIIAILFSILYYYRQTKKRKQQNPESSLILISSALIISYLLSSQIIFSKIINYEQTNYAQRLLIIISIFLSPFLILALNKIITKIRQEKNINQTIWLIFGLGLLSASFYLSYPRWDQYWNSHGYSTSSSDLIAVQTINKNTKTPYIVLANQQVSAAALQELGFNHYYQTTTGKMYFYPIPTGGTLYQYYLKMVYEQPSKKNILPAMRLTGVNTAYLIINNYWYQSDKLVKEAKLSATRWWNINNQDYIFQYKF